jgi:hypothetical protein
VISILRDFVIKEKDLPEAERQLLALPSLKRFSDNLKSATEKDSFRRHMRRYLSLYLPDCAFEILGTNRYTITTHEAMVFSRKLIRKGEDIKYLCGIRVTLTDEEEDDLKERGLDFSIVKTTRNNATSFLPGPVRFPNHDCKANAQLVTTGSTGMKVVATSDIEIGKEITVTYAKGYFGENNCECLCKTCEDHCRNGWMPEDQIDSNRSPKGAPEFGREESLDDLLETQPTSSGRSTSQRTSGHSRSLRASQARNASDANAPYQPEHERRKRVPTSHDPDPIRVPGDYLALSPHIRPVAWAHFGTCLGAAEQADEISTHSCQICQRHRQLYGYRWPKTKNSRYDNEERVYSQGC